MNEDLDTKLCEKYPKIFKDRHASMQVTLMCWGFECGSGWFNIIDRLCANIQGHIDWRRKQRVNALRFNRCIRHAKKGNIYNLERYFSFKGNITEHAKKLAKEALEKDFFQPVPEKIPQVVACQIKEKFGTLRFYYDGGDEYIHGLVAMAESMSEVTCEKCGSPGKIIPGGWLKTLCDQHSQNDMVTLDK